MTVEEFIEELKLYPMDAKVSIVFSSFEEKSNNFEIGILENVVTIIPFGINQ